MHNPLETSLEAALTALAEDAPELLGAAVTLVRPHGGDLRPRLIASTGVGRLLAELQATPEGGPVVDAARAVRPVLTADLWSDGRWHCLRLLRACSLFPGHSQELGALVGAVALPCLADRRDAVVLAVYSTRAPEARLLDLLASYERLVGVTVGVCSLMTGAAAGARRVLGAIDTRLAVDRAVAVVMALCRIDPPEAETLLRDAADRSRLPMAELAAQLITHARGVPEGSQAEGLWGSLVGEHWSGPAEDPGRGAAGMRA